MFKLSRLVYLLIFNTFFFVTCVCNVAAEDDIDLDFFLHKKSTIEDFPLQEVDQEELSNAAIAGALQANSTKSTSGVLGKPIYQEQKEKSDKRKSKDADDEEQELNAEEIFDLSNIQPVIPQFQQQIYQQPTGRSYSSHHTTTIERP